MPDNREHLQPERLQPENQQPEHRLPAHLQIAIVGAGLSGLYLAHRLVEQRGISWAKESLRVFESRDRCGGRIHGIAIDQRGSTAQTPYHLDLGPSWFWPEHQPLMSELVASLNLPVIAQRTEGLALYQTRQDAFPQPYRDEYTYQGACRLEGGCKQLVEALMSRLPESIIRIGHHLQEVRNSDEGVSLIFESTSCNAQQIVLTLPPRLIATGIQFSPPLPQSMWEFMGSVPTWMAGHAKVAIQYPEAFWHRQGFSGSAIANFANAPLAEVFDLCGAHGYPATLGAFMALTPALRHQHRDHLSTLIVNQLVALFGPQAANPVSVDIMDWAQEPATATAGDREPLTSHPNYGHRWFELDHWNDRLHFCGTETARRAGGYMEGALEAAIRVARSLQLSSQANATPLSLDP